MTREKDAWTVAALLVTQHGTRAEAVAERRAEDAAGRGDSITRGIWLDVRQCCRELLKDASERDEEVQ